MSRSTFIILFIGFNIAIIFLQIHKESKINELLYQNQKIEKDIVQFKQKKEILLHQLESLRNPSAVKEYAMEVLKMKKVALNQIKRIAEVA